MAEEKKKRRGRRAYLDDFRREFNGEYTYVGKLHAYEPGQMDRKRALTVLWGLTVLLSAAAVSAGCVDAAGLTNCWYVILPWTGSVVSAASVVWLMCRLSAGGDPLRDYVYTATVERFAVRGWLTAGFAACAILGELVFLLLHGAGERRGATAAFLVLMAAAAVAAGGFARFAGGLKWSK